GLAPNPKWLENLAQLKGLLSLDSWYAPGVQWVDRVFLLEAASNLFVWATGPALGLLLFLVAIAVLTRGLLALEPQEERPLFARLLAVFAPVAALLLWQLSRPVATVRYAHPALPLLVAASTAALPLLLGRFARLAGGVTLTGTALAGFA